MILRWRANQQISRQAEMPSWWWMSCSVILQAGIFYILTHSVFVITCTYSLHIKSCDSTYFNDAYSGKCFHWEIHAWACYMSPCQFCFSELFTFYLQQHFFFFCFSQTWYLNLKHMDTNPTDVSVNITASNLWVSVLLVNLKLIFVATCNDGVSGR